MDCKGRTGLLLTYLYTLLSVNTHTHTGTYSHTPYIGTYICTSEESSIVLFKVLTLAH